MRWLGRSIRGGSLCSSQRELCRGSLFTALALLEAMALHERLCPLLIKLSSETSTLDSSLSQLFFLGCPGCLLSPRTFPVLWVRLSKLWPPSTSPREADRGPHLTFQAKQMAEAEGLTFVDGHRCLNLPSHTETNNCTYFFINCISELLGAWKELSL